jgi:hypothetical protein
MSTIGRFQCAKSDTISVDRATRTPRDVRTVIVEELQEDAVEKVHKELSLSRFLSGMMRL